MSYLVPHYIDGKIVNDTSGQKHEIYNPAQGEIVGKVHFASEQLCNNAVSAAAKAWPMWSETTPIKRAQILFKFHDLLLKNQLDLAKIVTREHGKTIDDAKASVARAIEVVAFHCGLITQLQGTYSSNISTHIDCYTFSQSLGVCAGVSPFNFPVMVPIWMLIPAIACGNTFILKPSEQDPSAPIRLLELLSDAGLPPGVANCIQGDKNTVDVLLKHKDIAAFTAVASTPVAKAIYTQAISNGKRAHTFGGAKNHAVVMPDANFKNTAKALVGAAFGSAGERCMAISVVVAVGENTAENLLQHMLPLIHDIKIGPGDCKDSDLGPVISQKHRENLLDAIEQGVLEGANLLIDGRKFKHKTNPNGFFLGPCLFDNVNEQMSIYQKELFGPILVIMHSNSLEDALALVNRNQYGNGTAIFTASGFTAREYSQRVQVGMIGINVPIPVPIVSHPFGGWKQSSFGDNNMHGAESVHFYTKLKTITSQWFSTPTEAKAFVMPENG